MKNILLVLPILFVLGCNPHSRDSQRSIKYQEVVDSFNRTLKNMPITHGDRDNAVSNYIKDNFLKTFNCLTLDSGYVLDYYQEPFSTIGNTVVYARPELLEPLQNSDDPRVNIEKYQTIRNYENPFNLLQHINVKDSEIGYFELLVFDSQKECFHRPDIYDMQIICNQSMLREILSKHKDIPDSSKNRLYNSNVEPNIVMKEKEADIYLTAFSEVYGFKRHEFNISRSKPHKIRHDFRRTKVLLKYDCGMRY